MLCYMRFLFNFEIVISKTFQTISMHSLQSNNNVSDGGNDMMRIDEQK